MKNVEIFERMPELFTPKVEAAGCYVEWDGKLLLLKNAGGDSEPGTWGVPGGKLEAGELPVNGALRELFEETGIIVNPDKVVSMGALYIRKVDIEYVFHMFLVGAEKELDVRLSAEHEEFRWVGPDEVGEIPLMAGGREAYDKYRALRVKKRTGASVNAYLVLRKGDRVLLQLRKNTGYCDGMWSFVAGHVEDGESASAGMVREASEEIGIELGEVNVVHVMHRKTNRLNVDVFFECRSWRGILENRELEKCAAIEFFPLDRLPENMVDYNAMALKAILEGRLYSEIGWV